MAQKKTTNTDSQAKTVITGPKLTLRKSGSAISESTHKNPKLAGHADQDVPGADHSCLIDRCNIRNCNIWRDYAISIGRITEVGSGQYQSEISVGWHLFDLTVMRLVSQILVEGEKNYGRDAWHGKSPEHHINHAIEHLTQQLENDTSENHLGNALCRVMFAYGVYLRTKNNRLAVGQAEIEVNVIK